MSPPSLLFRSPRVALRKEVVIQLGIAGENKENENMGLDFPINIENRLNLSTTAHVIRIIVVTIY